MAETIPLERRATLEDYAAVAHLAPAVQVLEAEAERVVPLLEGRTLWMVNSTAQGGGVAEMLPTMVGLLRDLGIDTEWVVIGSEEPAFFPLTKRIHNLIHGAGDPVFDDSERELYERVSRWNAERMAEMMEPGDVLVVHDPQPMGLPAFLPEDLEVVPVWRCHIGLDEENAQTRAAWEFLEPWADHYLHAVFSAPEYIPHYFARRATIISPAIDPLADKNRDLSLHKLVGVLAESGLAVSPGPRLTPPYENLAQRIYADGRLAPANGQEDIGLLTRPIVTQISRWDRLKGFLPLMRAFAETKRRLFSGDVPDDPVQRRRLDIVRLVLAGPDPSSIKDDPESQEVFASLVDEYVGLEPAIQDDIAIVCLPMESRRENALMVNALQRASTLVAQNSLREGFGLTVTEAMWKHVPVLSNSRACGPRQQVRDGLDGRMVADPEDEEELRIALESMLADPAGRDAWGRSAQRRAHEEFLVFTQIRRWFELLAWVLAPPD
ncbi:MAG: glycosyltransferase [Gemmatimonadota bacterium]|nr:glycosyltransferase [Gemmatimonadota bacterium]